jgi:pimeloyl-ACP methyl ester carboxylesterase
MKAKNKIITITLLSAAALTGTALINKYIKMSATSRNLLLQPEPRCFKWRLGNVYYTKCGTGKPLLLIHDLNYASSGCEWSNLVDLLKDHYTVYTIDLLGCGRSEKPNLTYTNFLYVQLLNDFIKLEIGHRTNVIATGTSASLATMACSYSPDLFEQFMFINPESISSGSQIPGKSAKLYKFILDLPIIGTLLYHMASSKKILTSVFTKEYFCNPYDVKPFYVDKYYEAAHLGDSPKAIYSSSLCNYTKCNISRALEKIDNSIYLLGGAEQEDMESIIEEYIKCNPAIEYSTISGTKHLPQLENPKEVFNTIKIFFN